MTATLYRAFAAAAQAHPHKTFLIAESGEELSFGQVEELAAAAARRLAVFATLRPGARVALLMHNQPEFVITLLAANRLGLVGVPLNHRLTPPEIAFMLAAADCRVVVHDESLAAKLPAGDPPRLEARDLGAAAEADALPVVEAEDALVLFTSGTTGLPKGVLHTNANLLFYARVMIDGLGFESGMKQLIAAPLYHAIGLIDQLFPALILGETAVLTNDASPQNVAELLERHAIEILLAPPNIFALLLLAGMHKKRRLPAARIFGYAGAPMRPATIEKLGREFPHIKLFNFYGSTEVGGTITILDAAHARSHGETVGRAVKGAEVEVLGETGFVRNEVGEVVARPHFMKDYVNADRAASFTAGWLRMGDLGRLDDDGFLTLYGRMGDMLIVGGENVYPIEIERAVMASGLAREVAAAGRDTVLGHEPVAFVCPVEGASPEATVERLTEHCRTALADFKRPRQFIVLEEIPKNSTGKVDRKKLLALLRPAK